MTGDGELTLTDGRTMRATFLKGAAQGVVRLEMVGGAIYSGAVGLLEGVPVPWGRGRAEIAQDELAAIGDASDCDAEAAAEGEGGEGASAEKSDAIRGAAFVVDTPRYVLSNPVPHDPVARSQDNVATSLQTTTNLRPCVPQAPRVL